MKKLGLAVAVASMVGATAGTASAACDFNVAPAKGVKGSYVRHYAPCPGTENPVENTATEGGTEACSPVTPKQVGGQGTTYKFGPKGGCTIQNQAKLLSDCSEVTGSDGLPLGLQPGPCHITFIKGKCKGILDSGDTPISAETDPLPWSLATLSRATLADDTNGDMTVIDFPVTFLFGEPKNGGMKLSSSSAEALKPLVGPNNADLPDCTSIEIVDSIIKDPQGLPFARLGGATVPD